MEGQEDKRPTHIKGQEYIDIYTLITVKEPEAAVSATEQKRWLMSLTKYLFDKQAAQ